MHKKEYVGNKVTGWMKETKALFAMAKTSYSAYTHGIKQRWTFLMLTISAINALLKPLENAIKNVFIPMPVNLHALGESERDMALPARLGVMGMSSPEKLTEKENQNLIGSTRSLTNCEIDKSKSKEIRR